MADVYVFSSPQSVFGAYWECAEDRIAVYLSRDDLSFGYTTVNEWKLNGGIQHQQIDDVTSAVLSYCRNRGIEVDAKTIEVLERPGGIYYPRVWRGLVSGVMGGTYSPHTITAKYQPACQGSVVSATSLFRALKDLFSVIEPTEANNNAYGYRIRELLILACTEVEAAWKGVYSANMPSDKFPKGNLNRKHYRELVPILRLDSWVVRLKYYSYKRITPFLGWDLSDKPNPLIWYDAYNSVKHDLEECLSCATLENLLSAMAALFVMLLAQWGPQELQRYGLETPFQVASYPNFRTVDQYLLAGFYPTEWQGFVPHSQVDA